MAMTIKEFLKKIEGLDRELEVVTTFTKFNGEAMEQFADRVSVAELEDGRKVLAIDGYRHADNYTLKEE